MFGLDITEVTPAQRSAAKAVNFGIVYGISEFSLAEDIGVSRYEAKAYIDNYLSNYHGVRDYMKNIVVSDREYKQKALFSFLGYPLSAVESNYSETKIYEYYPFISIQNAVEVDNVKLHSVVPGIITSSSVCKREEYVGDRLVKEREYSNIGKQ